MRGQQLNAFIMMVALGGFCGNAAAQSDADAERRARVLASFSGGQITVGEMEDAIANKLPEVRAQLATAEGRAGFLRDLVNYELLRLEAERRGYATHAIVVEAWNRTAIEKLVAARFPYRPEAVPAEEVKSGFEAHARQFDRPAQRRASHILVKDEAEARALIKQLAGGDRSTFARLARERSQDVATRSRGGDLGHFDPDGRAGPRGSPVVEPAIAQATFALKRQGQVAREPVPVPSGFSVVMWTGESPAVRVTLAQVEPEIRERRATERQQREVDGWVAEMRKSLVPELHPERVDPIALDPMPPLDIPSGFPAAPPDPAAPPVFVEPDAI